MVRFDRYALSDDRDRAADWLRDGLAALRRVGYRMVIVGGQSRGGWNSLQALDTPGLADVVISVSPAAHGTGSGPELLGQSDDFRRLTADAAAWRTRLAIVQFSGDPFMGDADTRRLLETSRPRLGALLLVDRPAGFSGHSAANQPGFGQRCGTCLLHFALDPSPPDKC